MTDKPPRCACGEYLDWLPIPTIEQGSFFCSRCDENHPEYYGDAWDE